MESMINFFISSAHAETAGSAAPQGAPGMSMLLMFAVFFVFIYFTVWRPQSRRAREQQNLLSSLAKGDEVITAGGLLGRISKLQDQYIGLNIAPNTEIVMQKSSVVNVLPKGTLKTIE